MYAWCRPSSVRHESDSHSLHCLSNPGHETAVGVVALRREQVDFCPVFVSLLLDEPVRNHPLKILNETWIV